MALDMSSAVQNLKEPDPELQVLGAAFIQHECYSDGDAKNEVLKTDETWGQNSSGSFPTAIPYYETQLW